MEQRNRSDGLQPTESGKNPGVYSDVNKQMGKKRQLLLSRQPANECRTDGVRQPPLGENQHWLLEQAESVGGVTGC